MTACVDLLSEIGFRGLLHFRKDERADLARAVLLALHLDPSIAVRTGHDLVRDHSHVLLRDRVVIAPANEPLDREYGVFRIGDALPLRRSDRREPPRCLVKATMDGVVRAPSAFSITLGVLPSMTATQELVVPRSIPIALAMTNLLLNAYPKWPLIERASHLPRPARHRKSLGRECCGAVPKTRP